MPSVDDILAEHFTAYRTADPDQIWEEIRATHRLGESVTGRIVAKFPFGIVIDFGAAFPGILLGTRIPNMTAEELEKDAEYKLGRTVTARLERFATEARQIGLTRMDDSTVQPD